MQWDPWLTAQGVGHPAVDHESEDLAGPQSVWWEERSVSSQSTQPSVSAAVVATHAAVPVVPRAWQRTWQGELCPTSCAFLGAAVGRRADGRPPASPYLPLPPYDVLGAATRLVASDLGALAQAGIVTWRGVGVYVRDAVALGPSRTLYIQRPIGEQLFLYDGLSLRSFSVEWLAWSASHSYNAEA